MKHFFYAVYVLFYTGAVFLGGMFIGQFLERAKKLRKKQSVVRQDPAMGHKSGSSYGDRKVAVMRKRE